MSTNCSTLHSLSAKPIVNYLAAKNVARRSASVFQEAAATRMHESDGSTMSMVAARNDAERRATLLRVRYCGLFATDGRAARLEHCRKLIDAAADDATSQVPNDEPELLRIADEEADDEDEGIVPSGCVCCSCHAELEVAGRLKGTETLELLILARSILALLPTMMQWVQGELMEQLRSVTVDLQRLPKPLRKLLANPWWQPLELSALAALLQHDSQPAVPPPDAQAAAASGLHTSGIPPPKCSEKVRRA